MRALEVVLVIMVVFAFILLAYQLNVFTGVMVEQINSLQTKGIKLSI